MEGASTAGFVQSHPKNISSLRFIVQIKMTRWTAVQYPRPRSIAYPASDPPKALRSQEPIKALRPSQLSLNYDHLEVINGCIYMLLHRGRHKPHSALLTQLRTGKIDFNLFLKERCVLGVTSGTCSCDHDVMTMRTRAASMLELTRSTNTIKKRPSAF